MKRPPHSKDLRKGRHSEPGARYFVTFKTVPPSASLTISSYFSALKKLTKEMEVAEQISETSYSVMPDHLHVLFRLGEALTLAQVVGKLKQQTRKQSQLAPLNWQASFHDHKLRNDGELHPILHYIYLNPYRARLLDQSAIWTYVHIDPPAWQWLQPLLDKDCPYPEWLAD